MEKFHTISLLAANDIRLASEWASSKAIEMGFEVAKSSELARAVSEIARNVISYVGEGKAIFSFPNSERALTVTIKDYGSGIENLKLAISNGYSSEKVSLGIGLDVAERSVDEFEIKTDREKGTEVILRKFLPIPDYEIAYGVVSMVDERYAINGDAFLIREYDGNKVLMAVIDGSGGGYPAHAAAILVKEYLLRHYRLPLEELVENCHKILKQSKIDRGATIALARIASGYLSYLGVGDTHAYVLGEEMSYLHNHEGTVGQFYLPSLETKKIELTEDTYFILCTDGIKSSLWLDEDQSIGAQSMANLVFNEFRREYGDVTVLVAKHFKGL